MAVLGGANAAFCSQTIWYEEEADDAQKAALAKVRCKECACVSTEKNGHLAAGTEINTSSWNNFSYVIQIDAHHHP